MKKFYFLMLSSIASPIFSQEEPMFLDGRQEFIYFNSTQPITNKLIFKSEEILTPIHTGCLELEKISDNSFVYNTIFNTKCSFTDGEIPISYKSLDSDSSINKYFKLKQFYQPRITIGGITEGEKVNQKSLDISLLFINNDYFLEKTTTIVKTTISIRYKTNQRKPLSISLNGGKLSDKFKKLIQKRFDEIEMIEIDCLVQNTTLGYTSKINSTFLF
jgi:hypothetical protein